MLLLGVGHHANTSLHLAEYRQPAPPRERSGAAVSDVDGGRRWAWWEDVAVRSDDFDRLGADLDATGAVRRRPGRPADTRRES